MASNRPLTKNDIIIWCLIFAGWLGIMGIRSCRTACLERKLAPIIAEVEPLIKDSSNQSFDFFVVGHTVVWAVDQNGLHAAHWELVPRVTNHSRYDSLTIILVLSQKRVLRWHYSNGAEGYGDDAVIAAIKWPEKKVIFSSYPLRSNPPYSIKAAKDVRGGSVIVEITDVLAKWVNSWPSKTQEQWVSLQKKKERERLQAECDERLAKEEKERLEIHRRKAAEFERITAAEKAARDVLERIAAEKAADETLVREATERAADKLVAEKAASAANEEAERNRILREKEEATRTIRAKFRQPRLGSLVNLELRNGGKIDGVVTSLSTNSVTIAIGSASATFNRESLSERCQIGLFSDDYVNYHLKHKR